MSLTYAIADLHGRFDLLTAAFDGISKDAILRGDAGEQFKIVTLGDYVDRGPQSCQIIEHLMAAQAAGVNLICLKGNHEDMMVETLRKPLHPDWWIGNGGGATLVSYGHPRSGEYHPAVVAKEHLDWLDRLPLMHVDQHRVFVHAGVDPTYALDEQKEQVLLWWLYPNGADIGHGDRHVVHGHHQFRDGPVLKKNRTDLDTFAWYTGRLVVGVFDDDRPGGPIAIIEIKGPTA
jgi:serine/threonine protein phosphatase 1